MEKIFTAKSIDEAKGMAILDFGVDASRVSFTVLEEPKRGILGFNKGLAKISASYQITKLDTVISYLKEIMLKMNITAEFSTTDVDGGVLVNIEGEDMGNIIGKHGETIDALQYLAAMACNKNDSDYFRVTVDSCGYRKKRQETLEDLATKVANHVFKSGRTAALEPMNPYERRVVHAAVSNIPGVSSHSIGEEPFRRVVISSDNPVVSSPTPQTVAVPKPSQTASKAPFAQSVAVAGADNNTRSSVPQKTQQNTTVIKQPLNQQSDEKTPPVIKFRENKNKPFNNTAKKDYDKSKPFNINEVGVGMKSLDLKTSFEKDYKKPKPEDNLKTELYDKLN